MTDPRAITAAQAAALVAWVRPTATIAIELSVSDERRLRAWIARGDADCVADDDPIDLETAIIACTWRGLDASEADAGMWSDLGGALHDLPRPARSPLRHRIPIALRAARQAWRAS